MFTIRRPISEDLALNRLKLYTHGQGKASLFVECRKRSRLIDLKNTELEQTTSMATGTSSKNVTSRFYNHFQLFKVIMLAKCVLTILELSWNQHFGEKKTKLNFFHRMLTSSTQLQNWSFHVVERTRASAKCPKIKNVRARRAKLLFFIVKYKNLSRSVCRRFRNYLSSLIKKDVCLEHSIFNL